MWLSPVQSLYTRLSLVFKTDDCVGGNVTIGLTDTSVHVQHSMYYQMHLPAKESGHKAQGLHPEHCMVLPMFHVLEDVILYLCLAEETA